jgi:hypothetical protein
MKSNLFWDVMQCRVVAIFRRSGRSTTSIFRVRKEAQRVAK